MTIFLPACVPPALQGSKQPTRPHAAATKDSYMLLYGFFLPLCLRNAWVWESAGPQQSSPLDRLCWHLLANLQVTVNFKTSKDPQLIGILSCAGLYVYKVGLGYHIGSCVFWISVAGLEEKPLQVPCWKKQKSAI